MRKAWGGPFYPVSMGRPTHAWAVRSLKHLRRIFLNAQPFATAR